MRNLIFIFVLAALGLLNCEDVHSQLTASVVLKQATVNGVQTVQYLNQGDILLVSGELSAENAANQNDLLIMDLEWWSPANKKNGAPKTSLQMTSIPIPVPATSLLVDLPWVSAYGVDTVRPEIIFTIVVNQFGEEDEEDMLTGFSVPFFAR